MSSLETLLDRARRAQPGCEMRFRTERSGRRIVLLAPHPDDEAIGAGGSLVLEARAGADTLVHFMTDGARGASGQGGEGAKRRGEAAESARVLDLAGFLISPWQSRDLRDDLVGSARTLADMLAALDPDEVWMPSPYEGHPTHLAATLAGLRAVRELPARVRVLGYAAWDPIPAGPNVVVQDISRSVQVKAEAIRCHVSQCTVRAFDEAILARNRCEALLAAHTGTAEATHVEQFLDLTELVRRARPEHASLSELKAWMAERIVARFDAVHAQLGAARCGP
ncbi:MAG: PIG-L deacetylase family protein [Planctomycetota bacterium]